MATYTYTSQVVRYTLYTCTMYIVQYRGYSGRGQLHLHQPVGQVHIVHLYSIEVTVAVANYTNTSQVVRYTLYTYTA